jgi:hypothetical protein
MTTNTNPRRLFVALEPGWHKWLLACATEPAQKPRFHPVAARNVNAPLQELAKAKEPFGLPDDTLVFTCYEADRDERLGRTR